MFFYSPFFSMPEVMNDNWRRQTTHKHTHQGWPKTAQRRFRLLSMICVCHFNYIIWLLLKLKWKAKNHSIKWKRFGFRSGVVLLLSGCYASVFLLLSLSGSIQSQILKHRFRSANEIVVTANYLGARFTQKVLSTLIYMYTLNWLQSCAKIMFAIHSALKQFVCSQRLTN